MLPLETGVGIVGILKSLELGAWVILLILGLLNGMDVQS